MKNNQYKKYFDQVSPEQNLIEQTRKMMYDELNNISVSSYKRTTVPFIRYGVLAACAAIAAVTVAVVPKPINSDIDQPVDSDNHADVMFTDTESTPVTEPYVTSPDSMTNDDNNASGAGTQNNSVVSGIVTSVTVMPSNDHNLYNTQSQIKEPARTVKTTNSHDESKQTVNNTTAPKPTTVNNTTAPKHTTVNNTTAPKHTTANNTTSKIPNADCSPPIATVTQIPCCTKPVVTIPVTMPLTSDTVNSNAQMTTTPGYRPGMPSGGNPPSSGDHSDVENDTVYYIANVETDGYNGEVIVNIENEYYNHHYSNPQTVSVDDVEDCFGKDICPQVLRKQYSDYVIKTDEFAGISESTAMIFGEVTGLYVTDSKFVIMSASGRPNTLPYEYRVEPSNALATTINGTEYVFVSLCQYSDTFFCSYQKDGVYYSVCFKGYNITDIINLLLSF